MKKPKPDTAMKKSAIKLSVLFVVEVSSLTLHPLPSNIDTVTIPDNRAIVNGREKKIVAVPF
ncbi:hypothetical protein MH1LPH_19910 [Lactiplantibacillus brownii]